MKLSEAEIQLLACLYTATRENAAADRAALEACGERYWLYQLPFDDAFDSLVTTGLIAETGDGFHLTEAGAPLARDYAAERPDHYFYYYREFYAKAHASQAHSKLCEIAFGRDLTQEGQLDMDGVHDLLQRLALQPGQHLLDLGCGAGGIAEYMSDQTGARVTGVDYSAVAVEVGLKRTEDKRDRVDFVQADLNWLELEPAAYDAAVMIDSVYWIADTVDGLRRIIELLKPGGQLIILIACYPDEGREVVSIDDNFVTQALDRLQVEYSSQDLTEAFIPFWQRIKQALDQLHDDFVAEGNELIYQSLNTEAETEFLPAIDAGQLRRYLYHLRT